MEISADYLSRHDVVIWMTGDTENPFSDTDIEALEGAMDNGVFAFVFGEFIDDQLSGSDFYTNYLHAASANGNTQIAVDAIENAGGPIIPDSRLMLAGAGGAGNSDNPDVIVPVGGAVAAYKYFQTESVGGIYFEDENRKHVYFPFAFESTSGVTNSTTRHAALANILAWFDIVETEEIAREILPSKFVITSAYPNPFNPETKISVQMPVAGNLRVTVYNLLGQQVATLANDRFNAGTQELVFDGSHLSSGMYIVRAEADGLGLAQKKVLLLK
jgi:hypothetical protein